MRFTLVMARCLVLVLGASLMLVACQDDNDEVAQETDRDVIGSPTSAPGLEQDIEEISIEIEDGALTSDGIEVTQERPTVMTITNHDDVAYQFQIESLVSATLVPASDSVTIEFTTPVSEEYSASLLPESGGESLDTMTVQVTDPTGAPD